MVGGSGLQVSDLRLVLIFAKMFKNGKWRGVGGGGGYSKQDVYDYSALMHVSGQLNKYNV